MFTPTPATPIPQAVCCVRIKLESVLAFPSRALAATQRQPSLAPGCLQSHRNRIHSLRFHAFGQRLRQQFPSGWIRVHAGGEPREDSFSGQLGSHVSRHVCIECRAACVGQPNADHAQSFGLMRSDLKGCIAHLPLPFGQSARDRFKEQNDPIA